MWNTGQHPQKHGPSVLVSLWFRGYLAGTDTAKVLSI